MTEEHSKFKLRIIDNKVTNSGDYPSIGKARDNTVRIIVAVFDLAGFTNFFNKTAPDTNLIASSYVTAFLSWLNYWFNFYIISKRIPKPRLSKFLGDGVLYVWETEEGKTGQNAFDLMNFCWNMTRGNDRYAKSFLPQFMCQLGYKWDYCEYPQQLKASISIGPAVKYTRRDHPPEYVAESINIATRLCGCHPELYFMAHSNLFLTSDTQTALEFEYVEKQIKKGKLKGIDQRISVFIDKKDFNGLSDKSMFKDM